MAVTEMHASARIGIAAGTLAAAALAAPAFAAREARVAGLVVTESGAPIAGAAITITTPNVASYRLQMTTDRRGRFSAVLIDADWSYAIRAEKAGLTPSLTQVKLPPGANQDLSLTLHPPTSGSAPAASANDPEELFTRGLAAYNAGDVRTAGSFFVRATQAKRDLAKAYFWLAMCEFKMDRKAESRATFQRYLQLAPNGDQAPAARDMLGKIPPD
jgi:tetratricopeptide (TPR) repeat protein